MENFTTKLILKAKTQDVYEGLTLLISKWWSEMFEGSAEEQGDVFRIQCYDLCKNGWQSFLYSFNKFLTTGKGVPFSLTESN